MKRFIIILILALPFGLYSQSEADTCLTKEKLIQVANTIVELKTANENLSTVNIELVSQTKMMEELRIMDSLQLRYYEKELEIQNNIIKKYKNQNLTKSKWYDSKVMWFLVGATTIYLATHIPQ